MVPLLSPLWWTRKIPDYQAVLEEATRTRGMLLNTLKGTESYSSPGGFPQSLQDPAPPVGSQGALTASSLLGISKGLRSGSRVPEGCCDPHALAGVWHCHRKVPQRVLSRRQTVRGLMSPSGSTVDFSGPKGLASPGTDEFANPWVCL